MTAMRRSSFGTDGARHVDEHGSDFALAPLTGVQRGVRTACFHIPPGGGVGRHEATVGQLFAVVRGSGWVPGADGERRPIREFQSVYWSTGELHESGTDSGMTVIVIEGDEVSPYRART